MKLHFCIIFSILNLFNAYSQNSFFCNIYEYPNSTIPQFFASFVKNHQTEFYIKDSSGYISFCNTYNCKKDDPQNLKKYFTLHILHLLFTSKTASNGSSGEILNFPYFWHWVEPNPRHQIYAIPQQKLLKDLKPTANFAKYNSRADIDRTPYLYLSDMFTAKPQYSTKNYGEFYTFGWCSEREMACVNLLDILWFEGKVVAKGNHSWSEYWVNMKFNNGTIKPYKVAMDNTFDVLDWTSANNEEKPAWLKYFGNLSQSTWYNKMAHSNTEKTKLNTLVIPYSNFIYIENSVCKYFNGQ